MNIIIVAMNIKDKKNAKLKLELKNLEADQCVPVPERFICHASYSVGSQPIAVNSAPDVERPTETDTNQSHDFRPNPYHRDIQPFHRTLEKLERIGARRKRGRKVRCEKRVQKRQNSIEAATSPSVSAVDSNSDDEVYVYPTVVEEPTIISSDEDTVDGDCEVQQNDNLRGDSHEGGNKSLSHNRFGGNNVANIIDGPSNAVESSSIASTDNFSKPPRANRQHLKRSYDESESRYDLPERSLSKRRKSGSSSGSDCMSSEDSDDDDDDDETYMEPVKITRPYYLHCGEGVANAVTKYSKRKTKRQNEQNGSISLETVDSSDDSETTDSSAEEEVDEEGKTEQGNLTVTDAASETDDVVLVSEMDADEGIVENSGSAADETNENVEANESNNDKDDDNGVRSRPLAGHPEVGGNREISECRPDSQDQRPNYNVSTSMICYKCGENGHRKAFCPRLKNSVCLKVKLNIFSDKVEAAEFSFLFYVSAKRRPNQVDLVANVVVVY